ncbi:MAG TPA: dephospho-CoA kinase [Candidatus Sulfotelmatobacter sp.]|jgi:dephospho-CoA kinase|nr:dephospho-CoA kinase [Candidatus Sulfotelmatobacter sp.]
MIILGLTGSIGMGKTTAANMLRSLGIPVHDADDVVHRLLRKGGKAVPLVEAAFPHTVWGGAVDRPRLAARVFSDKAALKALENILHPLVHEQERRFLQRARRQRRKIVALDIPLLFETHGEKRCDAVAVLTCPAFLQEQRVMARSGMTHNKLDVIRHRQMSDADKRRRADFIIPTGMGRRTTLLKITAALAKLSNRAPLRGRKNA